MGSKKCSRHQSSSVLFWSGVPAVIVCGFVLCQPWYVSLLSCHVCSMCVCVFVHIHTYRFTYMRTQWEHICTDYVKTPIRTHTYRFACLTQRAHPPTMVVYTHSSIRTYLHIYIHTHIKVCMSQAQPMSIFLVTIAPAIVMKTHTCGIHVYTHIHS